MKYVRLYFSARRYLLETARYRMGYVEDVIGMFTRGEFLYTVYIVSKTWIFRILKIRLYKYISERMGHMVVF